MGLSCRWWTFLTEIRCLILSMIVWLSCRFAPRFIISQSCSYAFSLYLSRHVDAAGDLFLLVWIRVNKPKVRRCPKALTLLFNMIKSRCFSVIGRFSWLSVMALVALVLHLYPADWRTWSDPMFWHCCWDPSDRRNIPAGITYRTRHCWTMLRLPSLTAPDTEPFRHPRWNAAVLLKRLQSSSVITCWNVNWFESFIRILSGFSWRLDMLLF